MVERENSAEEVPHRENRRRCGKLRQESEFQRLRVEGRAWSGRYVVARVLPNEVELFRIGIVTSKRVGNAVRRNRARRLIREAVRRLCPALRPGWDAVIIARTPIVEARMPQVEADLEHQLRRAGLIERPPEVTGPSTGGREFSE